LVIILFTKTSHFTSDKPHYPYELPEGWCWTTLGEICCIKGGKRIPRGMTFAKGKTAHVYIRVTDMKDNTIKLSDLKYIDDYVYEHIKNYTINASDLYLTIAGTIGSVGIVPNEVDGMNLTENAAKLTQIGCIKEYLLYALLSTIAQEHFTSRFHQVAQPKLSIETASKTPIAIPPIGEQNRIVKEIKRYLAAIKIIEEGQTDLETTISQTKSKILDLAIHGKLVPQDPTDEPAAELLKRINPKAEITSDNGHYQKLPEGWCETTLKHVITIKSGCPINVRSCIQGHYPIYGGNGITGYTVDYNIKEPTIVIGRVGFYCGSVYLVKEKAWVSDNAFTTTIHKDISYKKYLYYLLQFLNLRKYSNSTAQPVISGKTIYPIHVIIPPINEQHRIVAKIEEIFAQLDAIEASL
jgi:type I restriction enzyme S subunit